MNVRFARVLRKNLTAAEKKLWGVLRKEQFGCKFRRQALIENYVVDFVCFEKKLIVEVDGGHHGEQIDQDRERMKWLENQGFKVLRFWNNEVVQNIEAVNKVIEDNLNPPSSPSPTRGEGTTKEKG